MQRLVFRLTGKSDLLQHNERLANPLDPHAKAMAAISKKRGKTEADYLELSKTEFRGGLYHDDDIGPYVKGHAIERALLDSAKKEKLGTTFRSYILCPDERIPLIYKGPRDITGLWNEGFYDQRMVKVQQSKTLRTRPKFPEGWQIEPAIMFDPTALDAQQIIRCMERAGEAMGIGDFRPRYGRFTVEVKK